MTRRTWTTLCCMTVLLHAALVVHPSVHGIDFGRLLKRPRKQQQQQDNAANPQDPEAQMDQVLSYKTACDQQLAQTMVILGEQKTAAEEALLICREHRATAHSDVEYLVKKVDIQRNEIEQADALCQDKLTTQSSNIQRQLEELQATVNQSDSVMNMLKEEHAVAIQTLVESHNSAMKEVTLTHGTQVEQLQREHQEQMQHVNQQLEEVKQDQQLERQTAETTLQTAKTEHQQAMTALEQDYQSQLASTQKAVQQQLDQTESKLKQKIQSLTDKVTSYNASLKGSQRDLQTVQGDYERALKKIAVLEDVTAWTLAVQEARDTVQYAKTELQAAVLPLYQHYQIDKKINRITHEYHKVKETALPVLQPVLIPLKHATQRLIDYHRQVAQKAFAKTEYHFVNDVCPKLKKSWKQLQRQHKTYIAKEYQQNVSDSINSACQDPTPFLTHVGYGMLFFVAFFLRWFILRTIFAIILLPFRIILFPFIIVKRRLFTRTKAGPASKEKQKNAKKKNGQATGGATTTTNGTTDT